MDFLQNYWVEFLTIAIAHLVAVASPGPDFAVVLKNSISYGRRAGIITSIGVGLGILVHVAYSLAGIGILIKTTPWLFTVFSYAAAGYLAWIGINAMRSKPAPISSDRVFNQWLKPKSHFVFPVTVSYGGCARNPNDDQGRLWHLPGGGNWSMVLLPFIRFKLS
jgi:threonine/homoserine/homoserine lactone efflux protein